MAFRIPTNLDTLVPPPSSNLPFGGSSPSPSGMGSPPFQNVYSSQNVPWRGTFVVSGLRASDRGSSLEIKVVGVEIDGDCHVRPPSQIASWPTTLFFSVPSSPSPAMTPSGLTSQPPSSLAHAQAQAHRARSQPTSNRVKLDMMHAWVRHYQAQHPMVSFMPERLRDQNAQAVNQTNFRNLSKVLWDSQSVAVVPWSTPSTSSPPRSPSLSVGGILIYPSQNSSTILTGVVFLNIPFPDFVTNPSAFVMSQQNLTISVTPSMPETQPSHAMYQQPLSTPSSSYSVMRAPTPGISPSHTRSAHMHSHSPITPHSYSQRHQYTPRRQSQSLSPVAANDPPHIARSQQPQYTSSFHSNDDPQYGRMIPPPLMSTTAAYPPISAPLPPPSAGSASINPNWPNVKDEDNNSRYGSTSYSYGGTSSSSSGGQSQSRYDGTTQ